MIHPILLYISQTENLTWSDLRNKFKSVGDLILICLVLQFPTVNQLFGPARVQTIFFLLNKYFASCQQNNNFIEVSRKMDHASL